MIGKECSFVGAAIRTAGMGQSVSFGRGNAGGIRRESPGDASPHCQGAWRLARSGVSIHPDGKAFRSFDRLVRPVTPVG